MIGYKSEWSLKTRILSLVAVLIIISATASWLAYRALSEDIIERWGQQVAEIQVRYDSARLLQSLEREIGLARQMAQSSALIQWAKEHRRSVVRCSLGQAEDSGHVTNA